MSKVVHLSDKAHARAKAFCKETGLRMSDWVASLINEAITEGQSEATARAPVSKKKQLPTLDEGAKSNAPPPYAGPPFWAKKRQSQEPNDDS